MPHDEPTHIAGLLVHATEPALMEVMRVAHVHSASIAATGMSGKIAIALGCCGAKQLGDCIEQLLSIRGVLTVSLTAHFEYADLSEDRARESFPA